MSVVRYEAGSSSPSRPRISASCDERQPGTPHVLRGSRGGVSAALSERTGIFGVGGIAGENTACSAAVASSTGVASGVGGSVTNAASDPAASLTSGLELSRFKSVEHPGAAGGERVRVDAESPLGEYEAEAVLGWRRRWRAPRVSPGTE
mgnify:CR=1 FL=1